MNKDEIEYRLTPDDWDCFFYYIKTIMRMEDFVESIVHDAPSKIFDEIHDAKLRIESHFIAFVKEL